MNKVILSIILLRTILLLAISDPRTNHDNTMNNQHFNSRNHIMETVPQKAQVIVKSN